MAENKQSFVLYTDLLKVIEKLVIEDRKNKTNYAGELFYHILLYTNDKEPIPINFIVELAFEPIKQQLKRDLKKYEKIVEKRSIAGLASAEKRKQNQQVSTRVESVQHVLTNPTVSDTDNVNDNVNVTDIILEREETPTLNPIFEKVKHNFNVPLEECKEEFLKDEIHLYRLETNLGLTNPVLLNWVDKYFIQLENEGLNDKSIKDAKSHFARWLPIKLKEKSNGKDFNGNKSNQTGAAGTRLSDKRQISSAF